jgi:site-specific recombinase XerD
MSAQLTQHVAPGLTLHGGRHRFASRALLPKDQGGAGADIRTVQELLNHKNVASTQIYTQVTDRQRRDAITALPVPASPQEEAA